MFVVDVLILLLTVIGFAYLQASALIWTLGIGGVLVLLTLFGGFHPFFLFLVWVVFLFAASFANLKQFRQKYFTSKLIKVMQKRMPPISETEREALEAGNVWWEKDLFCGRPDWKKLLKYPVPTLSQAELEFINNEVETLCAMLDDWSIINNDRDLPQEVWTYLKQNRFFGLVIPTEYGGHGFSALAHSTIVVKIATRSISTAVNTMVPNSLGPGELLMHYGTDEQKNYYLPRLAKGEEIPCFALTGPEAGSDAGAISDRGIVCRGEYQGRTILGIRLTWDKRYITLAPVATVLGIAMRLYDPDHLLGDKEDIGITLCLVPTNHPGIEIGNRHLPLHLAFMNGPTRGKDIFIPLDWIIGGIPQAGKGWRMLMECLSIGRSISLPALSTACAKLAYRATGAYSKIRRQFNTSIANFEGVEEALGQIAGYTYTNEACRIMTAGAVDLKVRPSIASAIAKYHMTEMARELIANSMDIHAGQGIQVGPRNIIASAHMATPVSITVEGANILTRNLIIFGQGAVRCHPYILQEVKLFSESDTPERTDKLDRLLLSHIGYLISNKVRSFVMGITGGKFIHSPIRGPIAFYYQQLTRMSSALALLSDICMMLLGGALKRRERTSARLGDMLSQLYLASSVLKYYEDNGRAETDMDYVRWCVQMCLYKIQVASDELLNNFPNKFLGKWLRFLIFPWGTAYQKPKDELYKKIVSTMLSPSEFRNRITRFCYLSDENTDPMRRLDLALEQVYYIEPLWKKFKNMGGVSPYASFEEQLELVVEKGVLTHDEAMKLREFTELHKEVIKVNEFTFDLSEVVS